MHHFIFPSQDTWISSGSSTIINESFKNQNFGKDQILEVRKDFFNKKFHHQTRALVQFSGTEFTAMSQSIVTGHITNPKFFLKLYEVEGNSNLSDEYTLHIQPISQSWTEGTGKFGDNPKNIIGCSWENRNNIINGDTTTWATTGASILNVSGSTQGFRNESADIEVEVTNMVNMWLGSQVNNNGMLIRIRGSQETDETTFCNLKFFGKNTHTIYPPRLEVRWDDHKPITGSNTGSLNQLTSSGLVDNHLYLRGLQESYKENDRVRFRIGSRKKHIQKTFTNSVHVPSGSYIPEGSGSYAIKDITTNDFIIPFSEYTSISCDTEGMYFNQWMDGFYPDRVYKILLKLKTDDEQEKIFDNDFEFIVRRN
tara:strand:+ start:3113 stop:4216 length:1104 start_codon:yes stop_codon:yes gene_type:complete